jgi:hypothetical protein
MWMNFCFIVRYTPPSQAMGRETWAPAVVIGGLFAAFLVFYIPVVKGGKRQEQPRHAS